MSDTENQPKWTRKKVQWRVARLFQGETQNELATLKDTPVYESMAEAEVAAKELAMESPGAVYVPFRMGKVFQAEDKPVISAAEFGAALASGE